MQKLPLKELVALLPEYGVKEVVCSPGSRNAAILQEIESTNSLRKKVVVDERTAGFVALGMSMVSGRPVALVCTSGSAVLNYSPAIAEAFYQGLPLIVISADRPLEWIDQDDSQTIRQPGVLSHIVKASYDIDGESSHEEYLWYTNRIVNEGLNKALDEKKGPVHFNIHLNGLVLPVSKGDSDVRLPRKIDVLKPTPRLEGKVIKELALKALDKKVMLIAGFMPPDNRLQKGILSLLRLPNVCIMAETVSNLHLPSECYMVDTLLFPMSQEEKEMIRPDIAISMGGALVSRKLKELLRSYPPRQHWTLNQSDNLIDCFQSLSLKIECPAGNFVATFAKLLGNCQKHISSEEIPVYGNTVSVLRKRYHKSFRGIPWSDLKALNIVLNSLPEETNLFLSNGTSVRYGQIIPYKPTHATYSNRGVSGIEGSTSTAIGGSLLYDRTTCLITGDMSFMYDISALGIGLTSRLMKIIVLDNGGGDIFRFIGATKNLPIREKYLCIGKEIPVDLHAAANGWAYFYADSEKKLHAELEEFFSTGISPSILHIDTRNCPDNAEILTKFLK